MPFDLKMFLDREIVEAGVLGSREDGTGEKLTIYSGLWNGDPPKEVLVFLLAGVKPGEPVNGRVTGPVETWGAHVQRLLVCGWRFDFLREQVLIKTDGGMVPVFGGDGAPIFSKTGMASVRVYKKLESGCVMIVQVGAQFADGIAAALAVKTFFGQFGSDANAIQICQTYGAVFGQA